MLLPTSKDYYLLNSVNDSQLNMPHFLFFLFILEEVMKRFFRRGFLFPVTGWCKPFSFMCKCLLLISALTPNCIYCLVHPQINFDDHFLSKTENLAVQSFNMSDDLSFYNIIYLRFRWKKLCCLFKWWHC